MPDHRWERHDRAIESLLGSIRRSNNGFCQSDVLSPRLAVQIKTRCSNPQWFLDAVDQSRPNAPDERMPLVTPELPVRDWGTRRLLIVDLDDFITEGD